MLELKSRGRSLIGYPEAIHIPVINLVAGIMQPQGVSPGYRSFPCECLRGARRADTVRPTAGIQTARAHPGQPPPGMVGLLFRADHRFSIRDINGVVRRAPGDDQTCYRGYPAHSSLGVDSHRHYLVGCWHQIGESVFVPDAGDRIPVVS